MGLLDDLKRQADELKAQEVGRAASVRANAEAVDRALRRTFVYLNDLGRQMKQVSLPCPFVYALPKVEEISGLFFRDLSADYRTKHFMDKDYYGEVHLGARACADRMLSVKRLPEEMERFRDTLWQYNVTHRSEPIRDARRIVSHEMFEIRCDFPLQAKFEGNLEEGRIRVTTKNVGGFTVDAFQLAAEELTERAVEEFAKYFIGRPGDWAGIVKASVLNSRAATPQRIRPGGGAS